MVAVDLTALVDEIRERRLSRNRHFRLMSRAPYRAAMRLKRYLDGVATELRRSATSDDVALTVERPGAGKVLLHLTNHRIQMERRCYLSEEELACLCRHHPDVRTIIDQGES